MADNEHGDALETMPSPPVRPTTSQRGHLAELARYFLRLGFLGFGGPVAVLGVGVR